MQNKPFKIAISGALGKMGTNLIKEIRTNNHKNISLNVAIVKKKHTSIQENIKKVIGTNNTNVIISDSLKQEINNFDVLIDFTNPKSTIEHLKICALNNKKIVIGTTGLSAEDINTIKILSKKVGIVFSPNYSIGINLMLHLLKKTTSIVGKYSDIEIIEAHHREKKDAPSGTAIKMGEIISQEMNWNFKKTAVYMRKGLIGKRKKDEIGFSTIRAGDTIGDHKVIFATLGERIEIIHKATNRSIFSKGAIKAAIWLMSTNEIGLFNMFDVLNI
ncbi:MAG: 4-hydroxy-tetrahydrodipicolinate reductase [Buchnera aphidicola (Meitanaphis microgallis)]